MSKRIVIPSIKYEEIALIKPLLIQRIFSANILLILMSYSISTIVLKKMAYYIQLTKEESLA